MQNTIFEWGMRGDFTYYE